MKFNKKIKELIIWAIKKFSLEGSFNSLNKLINHTKDSPASKEIVFAYFKDSYGAKYDLIEGLRDQIKPGWERSLEEKNYDEIPSHNEIQNNLSYSKNQIDNLLRLLTISSIKITQKMDILEIGASIGATTYQIASKNPNSVVGSEFVQYQINQNAQRTNSNKIKDQEIKYTSLVRNEVSTFFDDKISNKVSFIEDDICDSNIDSNSKDLILSWDTLEHLANPKKAFEEMYRILKPGGFTFHEYNSFFSFNGGHSLCTLDFMWGHVRLSDIDFERYVKQFRPSEYDVAKRFYNNNLNRMTINKLKQYIKKSGFKQVIFFPTINFDNYFNLTENIFSDSKRNYPSLELIDLLSPSICIGLRKPIS